MEFLYKNCTLSYIVSFVDANNSISTDQILSELVIDTSSNCSMGNIIEKSISNDQMVLDSGENITENINTNTGENSHVNIAGNSNVCEDAAEITEGV